MRRRTMVWIVMMLMGTVSGPSSSLAAEAQAEAVSAEGLKGVIEGTVKEVAGNGNYVAVTVSEVPVGPKDFSALVGKNLKVHAKMINAREFDPASREFVRSLKAGQVASLKVFWDRGGRRVRLSQDQGQGSAAAPSAASAQAAAPASEVTFPSQVQIGNVFTVGEKVEVEAAVASGASVAWTVSDYRGTQIDAGTAAVADHRVRIAPNIAAPGFYSVQFTAQSSGGEGVGATAMTTVAIVPPSDITKIPDSPFGVVTHFAQGMPMEVIPILVRAGIKHVRDELYWNQMEPEPGRFEMPEKFRRYLDLLRDHQITPLIPLTFGHPAYDHVEGVPTWAAAPYTEAGFEAYSRYCVEALKLAGPQVREVEIWNEYNGSFCRGPAAQDRPRYYTQMLAQAYQAIKAAHPRIKVVGGAMVKIPLPYAEKLFKQDALKYMDAIAVHPYRATPEGVEKELAALSEMMKSYNGGAAKPIWVTETGSWRDPTPERAMTAQYLVRMMTLMRSCPDVERIYWYLACDFREFKNMGLVHGANHPSGCFTPTMVYPAYANLIHRLYGANFGVRENTDARTRIYRFDAADRSTWVCWSTAETARLAVNTAGPVTRVNLVGGEERLSPAADGTLLVEVGPEPFYLVAPCGAVTSLRELPRADRILADAVEDFSGTQGQGGWSYHYILFDGGGYDPDGVKPMEWSVSNGDWDYIWQGPAAYLSIGETSMHPSAGQGKPAWAVRRWTSTFDGPARVELSVSRADAKGDGVGCKLFLDGRELASYELKTKEQWNQSLDVTLKRGARLDFVITPGPGTNHDFDSTGFRAIILTGNPPDAERE